MSIDQTIDRLTSRINGEQPAWLFVEAVADEPRAVLFNVSLLRPLSTIADHDSPQAIGDALAELFDGLADHIRATTAAAGDVDNSKSKTLASAVDS